MGDYDKASIILLREKGRENEEKEDAHRCGRIGPDYSHGDRVRN